MVYCFKRNADLAFSASPLLNFLFLTFPPSFLYLGSTMAPKVKNFTCYWLPLGLYCLAIYIQSDYPSPESLPSFEFSDKVYHLAAYAVMGALFYRAYRTLSVKNNTRLLVLLSMSSAALYGISDEIHQALVPYRDGSLADAIADILGAVCGVSVFHWWTMARRAQVGMRQAEFGTWNAEGGSLSAEGEKAGSTENQKLGN